MFRIGVATAITFFFAIGILAKTVYKRTSSFPLARVIESNQQEVLIDFQLSQVDITQDFAQEFGKGERFSFPGDNQVAQKPGTPDLPGIMLKIRIPDRGKVELEAFEPKSLSIGTYTIMPYQKPPLINGYVFPFELNNEIYNKNALFPSHKVVVQNCEILRDIRIARVVVYPLQYNPVTKETHIITSIKIRLSFTADRGLNELKITDKSLTRSFIPFYKDVLNFNSRQFQQFRTREGIGGYVFIGNSESLKAVKDFSNWKIRKGYDVRLADIDSIGKNASELDAWIEKVYNTWIPKPEYMLFCGGEKIVPTAKKNNAESDNGFGVIGSGKYPSIHIGRITAKDDDLKSLTYQVWKMRMHEMEPFEGSKKWLTIGRTWGSRSPNGIIPNGTIASMYEEKGLTITQDKEGQGAKTGTALVDELSKGLSIMSYIAHGSPTSWSSGKVSTAQISNIKNGRMLPWIWNIACTNSAFSNKLCFAEAWMCAGTIENPGGALGLVSYAPNASTASIPMFKKGQTDYFTNKELHHMGACVNYAKKYISNSNMDLWGAIIWGDPEIDLYLTDQPLSEIKAEYDAPQPGTFTVSVTGKNGPLEGALVGVATSDYTYLSSGYSNASGTVTLTLPPFKAESTYVTVSLHNHKPYLGVASGPIVTVTAPNGGEKWEQQKKEMIQWTNNFEEEVKIELLKGSVVYKTIIDKIDSKNPYEWEINKDIEDGKEYKIRITNVKENKVVDESNKDFIINTPPKFESNPVNIACVNVMYSYTIKASDKTCPSPSLTFKASSDLPKWLSLKDNNNGTATLSGKPTISEKGDHNVTIHLTDGLISDSDAIEQKFNISVEELAKPVIVKHPQNISVKIDNSAVFEIESEGKFCTYHWYKDDKKIVDETEKEMSIKKVKESDKGTYYCVVTNPAGDAKSESAQLKVTITALVNTIKTTIPKFRLTAFPDPVHHNETITFLFSDKNHLGGTIEIYDALGSRVYASAVGPGATQFFWNRTGRDNISNGTYCAVIRLSRTNGTIQTTKTMIGIQYDSMK